MGEHLDYPGGLCYNICDICLKGGIRVNFGIERIFEVDPWKVIESEFIPEKNKVAESIFSLSNEYMGVRGMHEEGFASNTLQGSYISGIYHKEKFAYDWERKAFPSYGNFMSNTTNWTQMQVTVGGETFNLAQSQFEDYRRELDMQEGVLKREVTFVSKAGERTRLRFERFLSYSDNHMGCVRLNVTALDHEKDICISMALDAGVDNQLFGTGENAVVFDKKADKEQMYLLMKVPSVGQYYIHTMAVETTGMDVKEQEYLQEDKKVTYTFAFRPQMGKEYGVTKFVSVWTGRDMGYPYGTIAKDEGFKEVPAEIEQKITGGILEKSAQDLAQCVAGGYDSARAKHVQIVKEMWEKSDIEIAGDPLSQQGIRYCIFQLVGTYNGLDGFANIGAKGLTGEHYQGRYFWDTESYCMPCYLFLNPQAAKNLIEYRYNTLNEARKRAADFDYRGAIYPWQTLDGSEDCMYWEYAYFEIHINGIIPYAINLYAHVTGDMEFLYTKGIEILVEQARFWADRAAFVPYRGGYAINRVTGPDEYQQLVNNNYYTNYMAKEAMISAARVIKQMREKAPEQLAELTQKVSLDMAELDQWKETADKMILEYNEKYDIFVQDDMFLSLEPKAKEELDRDRDIPFESKWTIDKFLKYDMPKQPDVLLMMFLFRDRFSLAQKESNFRFYEQRTVHGSSLSPSIHSVLASEIGRMNMAYEYYLWASRLDLDDYNTNADQGLHISAMSGTWLNVVYGIGGMITSGELLEFKPTIPTAWESYSFKISYRGSVVKVSVDKQTASFEIVSGSDIRAIVYGNEVSITSTKQTVCLPESFVNRPQLEGVIFNMTDDQTAAFAKKLVQNGVQTAVDGTAIEGLRPGACVVVDTTFEGLQRAKDVGMKTIGIGQKTDLYNADYVLPDTKYLTMQKLELLF